MSEVLAPGEKVLDLACGFGRLAILSMKVGCKVCGVDADSTAITHLKNSEPEGNWICEDILSFKPSFEPDWVILSNILEHLEDPEEFLKQTREFANKIIVEVPDFDSDPLNYSASVLGVRWYSDADHVREYTIEALKDLLDRTGWLVTKQVLRGQSIGVTAIRKS